MEERGAAAAAAVAGGHGLAVWDGEEESFPELPSLGWVASWLGSKIRERRGEPPLGGHTEIGRGAAPLCRRSVFDDNDLMV